jgi:Spy/CpxP family protein refolding chaperone
MSERGVVRALVAAAAVATAAIGVAASAGAQGGGEAGGGVPGVGVGFAGAIEARWLERHAGELGLDEPTLAKVRAIGEEASSEWKRHAEQLRSESRRLSEGLAGELPDEAALARQAQAMGRVWTEGLEARLRSTVKLRQLLTPEQRRKAAELRQKQPARRRGGP